MATADRVTQWRRDRRADLVARRLSVSASARRRWSATIADFLRAGFAALAGRTIGVYSPFRGEPNVRAAIDHWRAIGATTALPVVVTRGSPLEFRAFWPGVRMRRSNGKACATASGFAISRRWRHGRQRDAPRPVQYRHRPDPALGSAR